MSDIKIGNKTFADVEKINLPLADGSGTATFGEKTSGVIQTLITWDPCPTVVRNFLENVVYDPNDYTVSKITDYASGTEGNYPIGITVEVPEGKLSRAGYTIDVADTVTLYNDIPDLCTDYTISKNEKVLQAGTLKPIGHLRRIKSATTNVRDLGGWNCDGGTVKYGKLYRGGEIQKEDVDIFTKQLGIRQEMNLRGKDESGGKTESILGSEIGYVCTETYTWYSLANETDWKITLRTIFAAIAENKPVYFHCSAGADRTGTVACILEAILGIRQSDIDKEYELTNFWTGVHTDNAARRRNEAEWSGLIKQINSLSTGSTFRDKVINWVATLGFTEKEINNFRKNMINGTPDEINLEIGTQTITNNLASVNNSNTATNIAKYQPYKADITVPEGYAIEKITVTMGGQDITKSVFDGEKTNLYRSVTKNIKNCKIDNPKGVVIDGQGYVAELIADPDYTLKDAIVTIMMGGVDVSTFYSGGKIAIPNVTGDIVITAEAVKSADTKIVIPFNWNDNYGCNYKPGEKFGLIAVDNYACSDVIEVTPGVTYTLAVEYSGSGSAFRFVGGDDNNLVTEATSNTLSKGTLTFTFAPSSGTTKLIIRTYSGEAKSGTWKLWRNEE